MRRGQEEDGSGGVDGALLNRMIDAARSLESTPASPSVYRAAMLLSIIQGYPRAKRYLIERGRTSEEVEAMPVAQVVLLYTVKLYDEFSDDEFKWFFLPAAEAGSGVQRSEDRMRDAFRAQTEILPFASLLLPAAAAAKNAETRCQWTVDKLRIFEALRLYAAGHDGRLPDRLDDITEVPIPLNIYDGKPFLYQREGDTAMLTSQKGPPSEPWRCEITLRTK